jgi:N-acetylmuramoyl-L-alanine amidase
LPIVGKGTMQLRKKKDRETESDSAESPQEDVPASGVGEEGPTPGEEHTRSGDFFDLPVEEVASYRPTGVIVAPRKQISSKPTLEVLMVLLVLGAVAALVVVLWPSSSARVPRLVGKNLTTAMQDARGRGFAPVVSGWAYSDDHADGVILAQQPSAGKTVRKGAGITLTVSKGPSPDQGEGTSHVTPQSNAQPGQGQVEAGPLSGKTVTVDPGSQAIAAQSEWSDPGMTERVTADKDAKGVLTGNDEYLVDLDIALKVKSLLEKEGVKVVMTRKNSTVDLTNAMRADVANNASSDLLLSIHCNSSDDQMMKGIDTLYPAGEGYTVPIHEKSKGAALFIQAQLVKACGVEDLGVLSRQDMPIFNWSKVPAVQVEVGYLSSPRDDSLLAEEQYRSKVAKGLCDGIVQYFKN